jgi:hypothetical protein
MALQIYPNWYFWFENKPSGNRGVQKPGLRGRAPGAGSLPPWRKCRRVLLLRNRRLLEAS